MQEGKKPMYQQITLVGNLGADPEMRYTPSGVPVTTLRVAVNRKWTGQDGQPQEKTTWFEVTAWRKLAEVASQYLTKGRQVLVVGEIEDPNLWTDREGNARASLRVTASNLKFIGGRGDTGSGDYSNDYASAPSGAGNSAAGGSGGSGGGDMSEDDIPF
jgi:single-strand DNA-binding protein